MEQEFLFHIYHSNVQFNSILQATAYSRIYKQKNLNNALFCANQAIRKNNFKFLKLAYEN